MVVEVFRDGSAVKAGLGRRHQNVVFSSGAKKIAAQLWLQKRHAYLNDLLAAMAEEVAWLTLCLTGVHTFWEHRRVEQAHRLLGRLDKQVSS